METAQIDRLIEQAKQVGSPFGGTIAMEGRFDKEISPAYARSLLRIGLRSATVPDEAAVSILKKADYRAMGYGRISVRAANADELCKAQESGADGVELSPDFDPAEFVQPDEIIYYSTIINTESELDMAKALNEKLSASVGCGLRRVTIGLSEYGDGLVALCAAARIAFPAARIFVRGELKYEQIDRLLEIGADGLVWNAERAAFRFDAALEHLLRAGKLPTFCTACREEGRCGKQFRPEEVGAFCFCNALVSLKEQLTDSASQDTRIVGTDLILNAIYGVQSPELRSYLVRTLKEVRNGTRGKRI